MFFNELELLKIRFEELYNTIDKFVLVEATQTHSGKQKPLWYQENKKNYEQYADKIIHVIIDDFPDDPNPWIKEKFQRDQIVRGLTDVKDSDIVIVSDADEIPRAQVVKTYNGGYIGKLVQSCFYYFMNLKGHEWFESSISRWEYIKNMGCTGARYVYGTGIFNGGWHFSYLGGWQAIRMKLESFAHQELNNDKYNSEEYISQCINKSIDLRGRAVPLMKVEIDSTFPKYVIDNLSYYQSIGYIKS